MNENTEARSKMITFQALGALIYDHIGEDEQKFIHSGDQMLYSTGYTPPDFEEFQAVLNDMWDNGYPSSSEFAEKGSLLPKQFYEQVYIPTYKFWEGIINEFHATRATKH